MKNPRILAVVFIMNACSSQTPPALHTTISIVNDVTDSHSLRPMPGAILKLTGLAEDKRGGATLRYVEIVDRQLVPIATANILDQTTSRQKQFNRDKTVLLFYDSVRSILNSQSESHASYTLPHSECFRTIAAELRVLSSTPASRKLLLVYSDLNENSDIASFYESTTYEQVGHQAASVQKKFEATNLLPTSLKNIIVIFLYQPLNRKDDARFNMIIEHVFRPILERRHARVVVQAQTNYFDLE